MGQVGENLRLAQEPLRRCGGGLLGMYGFDRNGTIELRVVRADDDAHAAPRSLGLEVDAIAKTDGLLQVLQKRGHPRPPGWQTSGPVRLLSNVMQERNGPGVTRGRSQSPSDCPTVRLSDRHFTVIVSFIPNATCGRQ